MGGGDGFEPFIALRSGGEHVSGQVLEGGVGLGAVPVFDAFGDVDDVARLEGDGVLAPFLVPAAAAHADEDLAHTVVDVPIVAAAGSEGHVGVGLRRRFALGKVLGLNRSKITSAGEVLRVCGIRLTHEPLLGRRQQVLVAEILTQLVDLLRTVAHVHGPAAVRCQLCINAGHAAEGCDGNQLAVGHSAMMVNNLANFIQIKLILQNYDKSPKTLLYIFRGLLPFLRFLLK